MRQSKVEFELGAFTAAAKIIPEPMLVGVVLCQEAKGFTFDSYSNL